jgi:hypothetical protein
MRTSATDEQGQALVVVGLAMFVLVAAIALSVDWGYSFATRRGAQNEADAAALAAGRLLASTYVGGVQPFQARQEDVWCEAARVRDANIPSAPAVITRTLSVSFSADATVWTTINTADCNTAGTTDVPAGTRLVRVISSATYRALFASLIRQPFDVAASARVQLTGGASTRQLTIPPVNVGTAGTGLSGDSTWPNVAIWPIVRRFDAADFATPCGQYCGSTSQGRIVLFGPSVRGYGGFTGLVTFSHYSTRESQGGAQAAAALVHQPITESDYTGSPNAHHGHTTLSGIPTSVCGTWDTNGSSDLATATSCDVPNWMRYGFRGSLSLSTNWDPTASWSSFEAAPQPMQVPDPLPARAAGSCPPSFLPTPSCNGAANLLGDWVETVPGDPTAVMTNQMIAFVQTYGRNAPNGRGLAAVIHVFLWDCADHFNVDGPVGGRWSRITANCGAPADDPATRPDRVHLLSVVPMTVYATDIRTTGNDRVVAYWGDVFADAGVCAAIPPPASGCDINESTNAAYLIPDE